MLDSGATGTFVASDDALHLQHRVPISNGPTVLAANGNVMRTTSVGQLPLSPFLSSAAQSAYVIDELQTGTLISLGQLCDDDVTAVFSKTAVNLLKNNHQWSLVYPFGDFFHRPHHTSSQRHPSS